MTLGSPDQQTGGYLYHRRLAESAPRHDADMTFVSFPQLPFPSPIVPGRRVLARAADADVIVVDSIATAFAAPWLGGLSRPLVGMLHQPPGGIDHHGVRALSQAWLDRRAYEHLEVLLAASEALAVELRPLHQDVRVVPPGRDVAAAADPVVRDLRAGRRAAMLCVGNWVRRKGIVELLDAFATLPDDAATLHLAGDSDADARYARAVRERLGRLGDRVVVHGVVPKETVAALYRDADVFVMPSRKEPYGTAYGEAMAYGLPVVGWRAGNLPHLAEDGVHGFVLEPGDQRGLAGALRRLSDDHELRAAMADAARTRAATFPTWEDTGSMFFSALRDVARG